MNFQLDPVQKLATTLLFGTQTIGYSKNFLKLCLQQHAIQFIGVLVKMNSVTDYSRKK